MILTDKKIAVLVKECEMISDYVAEKISNVNGDKVISFGQGGHSYDPRSNGNFLIAKNNNRIIDPKHICVSSYYEAKIKKDDYGFMYVMIPPKKFFLTFTKEYFKIPKNIAVKVMSKSTYARCGMAIETTFVDPSFNGQVMIELYNRNDVPLKVYVDEGFVQFVFETTEEANISYADSDGKYMGQTGMTLAKV